MLTTTVAAGSSIEPVSSGLILFVVRSSMPTFRPVRSTVMVPVASSILPAASAALTLMSSIPSLNAGIVLSSNVHVPLVLFTAVYVMSAMVTVTTAVGSSIVPVNTGVLSLVVKSSTVTAGTVVSMLIVVVALSV